MKKYFIILSVLAILSACAKKNGNMGKSTYEGEDMTGSVNIIRNKDTKKATLVINVTGKWVLYAGNSVDEIDYSEPVAGGFEAGRYPLDVSDSTRVYFQLVTDKGRAILSEKRLPMKGGYNFRDLGGIKNKDGKYVKWGRLFRSDDLHNLTDEDLKYLSSIPIVSVADFRSEEEIKAGADKLPESVKNAYPLSITPGNLSAAVGDINSLNDMDESKMVSLMEEMNRLLVSDSAAVKQYREFFRLLQNEKNVPLLFHCSAGKDRTGMAAALILFALNVDENVIMEDYLASNSYLGDKYKKLVDKTPNLKPLFEVKPEYLTAGIEKIKKEYGSVENYLSGVLHVDIDKFREMYLY